MKFEPSLLANMEGYLGTSGDRPSEAALAQSYIYICIVYAGITTS